MKHTTPWPELISKYLQQSLTDEEWADMNEQITVDPIKKKEFEIMSAPDGAWEELFQLVKDREWQDKGGSLN